MAIRAVRLHQWSRSSGRPLSRLGHDSDRHRVHIGGGCPHRLHTRYAGPQPCFSLRRVPLDTPCYPVELAVQQQQLLTGGDGVLLGLGADIVSPLHSDSIAVASRTIVVARCGSSRSSSSSSGRDRSSTSATPPRLRWTARGS